MPSVRLVAALTLCLSISACASTPPPSPSAGQAAVRAQAAIAIATVPATQPAAGFSARGEQGIFFDSVPWHGKPTRVFAWIGYPPNLKAGEKVPAVVLVHGGGGTAFAKWVGIWTSHGYAAIAMDTCGQLPRGKPWQRDSEGGPPGWGGFDHMDDPPTDQWPYHAAIDVILANSLLRSLPNIDTSRVGLVGISWGGYLTCICAGLDDRYAFAIPVYGCGFLGQDSAWVPNFKQLGPQKAAQWLEAWDPSHYLPAARMPLLWVDGTNDVNYPFEILQESYRLPPAPRTLVTRVRMHHSHSAGWAPPEIYAFADSICKGAAPLAH
ncbi:MAG TPA: acetylxylan esterase, partial [Tepidisphaeraceae bacterium]|nr:acetylxylan esterase [Tepidisphaeraceae bacterium]